MCILRTGQRRGRRDERRTHGLAVLAVPGDLDVLGDVHRLGRRRGAVLRGGRGGAPAVVRDAGDLRRGPEVRRGVCLEQGRARVERRHERVRVQLAKHEGAGNQKHEKSEQTEKERGLSPL